VAGARQLWASQCGEALHWNRFDRFSQASGELLSEEPHQQRYVFWPLAQRRDSDGKYVETIIEITAKLFVGDHFFQITVGCDHQADIHTLSSRASQALKLLLLQHAQQLGLQLQRDVTHLVQEQRAAVRQLKAADAPLDGTGERPSLVAEKFTFQEAGWDCRAVHLDQGVLTAGAQVMDGTGD